MSRLQNALDRTAIAHGPGLVGLVTERGEPVFEAGTGVADLDTGRAPTADDRFRIGNITKTYVPRCCCSCCGRARSRGPTRSSTGCPGWCPAGTS